MGQLIACNAIGYNCEGGNFAKTRALALGSISLQTGQTSPWLLEPCFSLSLLEILSGESRNTSMQGERHLLWSRR